MSSGVSFRMSHRAVLLAVCVFLCLSVQRTWCQDYMPADILLLRFMNDLRHNLTSILEEPIKEFQQFMVDQKKTMRDIHNTLLDIKNLHMCSQERYTPCPSGWRRFEGSCYHISVSQGSWNEGLGYCKNLGGDYVKISSREENDFIFDSNKTINMWIGLNDLAEEGVFRWSSDDSAPEFTDWHDGEPNNAMQGEDCAHYHQDHHKWNDIQCSKKAYFACEMRVNPCESFLK